MLNKTHTYQETVVDCSRLKTLWCRRHDHFLVLALQVQPTIKIRVSTQTEPLIIPAVTAGSHNKGPDGYYYRGTERDRGCLVEKGCLFVCLRKGNCFAFGWIQFLDRRIVLNWLLLNGTVVRHFKQRSLILNYTTIEYRWSQRTAYIKGVKWFYGS